MREGVLVLAAGVDLGLADLLVTSDGERIACSRHLVRKARNLARYQRRMARCRRGSGNRRKAKVARAHRKVGTARQDFLHRTTTGLVRSADVIVIDRWFPVQQDVSGLPHPARPGPQRGQEHPCGWSSRNPRSLG